MLPKYLSDLIGRRVAARLSTHDVFEIKGKFRVKEMTIDHDNQLILCVIDDWEVYYKNGIKMCQNGPWRNTVIAQSLRLYYLGYDCYSRIE